LASNALGFSVEAREAFKAVMMKLGSKTDIDACEGGRESAEAVTEAEAEAAVVAVAVAVWNRRMSCQQSSQVIVSESRVS
jgi:hypothetical protein